MGVITNKESRLAKATKRQLDKALARERAALRKCDNLSATVRGLQSDRLTLLDACGALLAWASDEDADISAAGLAGIEETVAAIEAKV